MSLGDCYTNLMENAANLQHFIAESALDSDIHMGRVGTWKGATDLESIKLSVGVSSEMTSHGFEAYNWYTNNGATVNSVDINVLNSGELHLMGDGESAVVPTFSLLDTSTSYMANPYCPGPWLEAASLNAMNVNVAQGGFVDGGMNGLVGLDLGAQAAGSQLNVSGEGSVTGFAFLNDNVSTIDATGLKGSGLVVAMLDEANASGFTFKGSEQGDRVYASDSADVLYGNGGNDVIRARDGNDIVDGGAGDDLLYGGAGNDTINGGDGDDFIAGDSGADVLTGGAGQDAFYFYFGDDGATDAGKSTNPGAANKQDIITDFTFGEDTLYIDIEDRNNGYFNESAASSWSPDGQNSSYAMYVTNMPGANPISSGGYIGNNLDPIHVLVRVGTYNENGTFNYNVNGDDLQFLFNSNGAAFNPADALLNNGNVGFSTAVHEVALLGAASELGSLSVSDLVWV
ncbi:calcium-binding protein [Allopusillimonas ginsengisoli]|nr:calcium-binding protein [Allopusillimonas ginsengisoli]